MDTRKTVARSRKREQQTRRGALAAFAASIALLSAIGWAMTCRAKVPPLDRGTGKSVEAGTSAKDDKIGARAVRYTLVDLGVPPLSKGFIYARGMSPDGRYVVGSYSDDYNNRAYRWEAGVFTDLSQARQFASAWAVNDAGAVAGEVVNLKTQRSHAVLWKDGKQHDLFDDKYSRATAIDRKGNIYGSCTPEKGESGWRAYIRDPKGRIQYLKDEKVRDSFLVVVMRKDRW